MASALKCDICGAYYDRLKCNDAVLIYLDLGHMGERYVDLCDSCYNKLCDFVAPTIPKDYSVER